MDRIRLGKPANNSDLVIPLWRTFPDGRKERITSFTSQEEMLKAMSARDPRTGEDLYQTNQLYRDSIQEIVANTPAQSIGVELEPRSPIPDNNQMLQGLREDALRAQYEDLIEKAGGGDRAAKMAKYNLALMMTNPTDQQFQSFGELQQLTQPEGNKPMESYLKERKEAGLGPWRETVPMETEEERAAYEQRKNDEALQFLADQELDDTDFDLGGNGVNL